MRPPLRTLILTPETPPASFLSQRLNACTLSMMAAALILFVGFAGPATAQTVNRDVQAPSSVQTAINEPTVTITADKDAMLRAGSINRNEGANPLLHLSTLRRPVVGFDLRNVDLSGLTSATLVLTIKGSPGPFLWGFNGRTVDAHRLLEDWAEGNGKAYGLPFRKRTRGEGEGTTWRCAIDTNIANFVANCNPKWNGGNFEATASDQFLMTNGATGEATWDVTTDVLEGFDSWLIKKTKGLGIARFYSRDNEEVVGNPDLAPRLVLTFADPLPVADPQEVFTNGDDPLEIILTGSDPDGGDLSFSTSALAFPIRGTLSTPVLIIPNMVGRCSESGASCEDDNDCSGTETCVDLQQPPITSASVTYTPASEDNEENSFTFVVTNPAGDSSDPASVEINQPGDPTDPEAVTEVTVSDVDTETLKDTPLTITLAGAAAEGVTLTYSIVGTGPSDGILSALTDVPPTNATVLYTPDSGFEGEDSFDFEACDTANPGDCDTATVTITVSDPPPPIPDPDTVTLDNVTMQTEENKPLPITLTAATSTTGTGNSFRIAAKSNAATLIGADIAGNVSDANGDGFGDETNNLPGPAPVLMVAGVDLSGGDGTNGTVRMQIEFDVSGVDPNDLATAEVILHTSKGTTDELDIFFFAGGDEQDGLLSEDDFEAPVFVDSESGAPVVLAPMPVTPGENTFEIDVLDELKAALESEQSFFSIQGRVDETEEGPARGLQVRTTADNNLNGSVCPPGFTSCEPMLLVTTPGLVVEYVVLLEIKSLPAFGELIDENGRPLGATPYPNGSTFLYTPNFGFVGEDTFQAEAQLLEIISGESSIISTSLATVTLNVGTPSAGEAVEMVNHPNPFNPNTTISFTVPEASYVTLAIYDVLGRKVRVLVDGTQQAGTHEAIFEASDLSSGTYFMRLTTDAGVFTKTMLLLK